MRVQTMLLIFVCLCLMPTAVRSQEVPPAPEFLYRTENRLILLNGYTGEASELPLEIAELDRFVWSPDGRYLLAQLAEDGQPGSCLNLYDVDAQAWAYDEPIACTVRYAAFSLDSLEIAYTTEGQTNGALWLYDLASETNEELYGTTGGEALTPMGVSNVQWSPTNAYLSFVHYTQIMGGTLNTFVVMNVTDRRMFTVNALNTYYAAYRPIWSADDRWFLLELQDEYVTSGAIAQTNHQGDVYLVNVETGEAHRLTYTPTINEYGVRWTEEGDIAFIPLQESVFTIEQALNIEVVPPEAIITPEPFDSDLMFNPRLFITGSPDANILSWVTYRQTQAGGQAYELVIGSVMNGAQSTITSVPIPNPGYTGEILIGWRPSDFLYP